MRWQPELNFHTEKGATSTVQQLLQKKPSILCIEKFESVYVPYYSYCTGKALVALPLLFVTSEDMKNHLRRRWR